MKNYIIAVFCVIVLALISACSEKVSYLEKVEQDSIQRELLTAKKGDLLEDNKGWLYHVVIPSRPSDIYSQVICNGGPKGRFGFYPAEAKKYIKRIIKRNYDKDSLYARKAMEYLQQ